MRSVLLATLLTSAVFPQNQPPPKTIAESVDGLRRQFGIAGSPTDGIKNPQKVEKSEA